MTLLTTIATTGTDPRATNRLLRTLLCRCNKRILEQKIALMDVLTDKYGAENANKVYYGSCPIVGNATIGQHYRHSLDHIQRAVDTAIMQYDIIHKNERGNKSLILNIDYDTRVRGSSDEHDWTAAFKRIQNIQNLLEGIIRSNENVKTNDSSINDSSMVDSSPVVNANFMLSGDSSKQFSLPTTVDRELGFAAHHAIHHMAMVRVIVTASSLHWNTDVIWRNASTESGCVPSLFAPLLKDGEIPLNFGKAPSTINYETNIHCIK